ncbi:hypothetical protein [Chitinimonas sp.]|uniref:hypothetical protein n=1 Tax=Chitinimonas sp. TaxID=1934313 RepID=UPI0035B2278F
MTTSNEQVAKLPLLKRVIILVRGGGGVSPVILGVILLLVVLIGILGLVMGFAVASKRNHLVEQNLTTQLKQARGQIAKLDAEKKAHEKELEELKETVTHQQEAIDKQKEELAQAKTARETMEKVLADIKTSLEASSSGKGEKGKAEASAATKLKFGNQDCDTQKGSAVNSKADLKCLNLKEAIDAMNSKAKSGEKTPAKSPG